MKVLRMLLWPLLIILIIVSALLTWLYFYQRHMVFFPSRELAASPSDYDLRFEDVRITVTDGTTLHGWYILPAESRLRTDDSAVTVLFSHGNAGNISHRLELANMLVDLGVNCLLYDYRGYGQSTGSPDEKGIYEDARACYNWLTDDMGINPNRIVIYGRSLGGTVAVNLAAEVVCRGLIIESSFTSAADMARMMFPVLPVGLILRYKFDAKSKIAELKCPKLMAHSPVDEIIPYEMGEKLFAAAAEPKVFFRLSGGHNENDHFNNPDYRKALRAIIYPQQID